VNRSRQDAGTISNNGFSVNQSMQFQQLQLEDGYLDHY